MQALLGTKIQLKKKFNRIMDNFNHQQPSNYNNQQSSNLFSVALKVDLKWLQDQRNKQQYQIMSPNNNLFNNPDIGHILEQQIIYMEVSPQQKKLQQIKQKGGVFKDDRFPPNLKSLTGEFGNVASWSKIKWEGISALLPNPKIFQGKVQPNDIAQGYLGDCYFLAGLAALAEKPQRIYNLFLLDQPNPQKYYSVKMLYRGKWVTIDMDQYIPVLYNQPAFSKSKNKQLWVMLLEKAWAKLYTSYKRIEAGYPQQPLHDLTGAPIKQIYTRTSNQQGEWKYLMMASDKCYAMVCSSQPGSDTNKSSSGIVQGHAYTLMKVVELTYGQNRKQRLVKLRNPWGKSESVVDWSDNDSRWNQVSPQEKQRVGYSNNKNDGTFFMTYSHFMKQFRAITVAQVNDNASYVYQSHKDRSQNGCYFKIKIIRDGQYCLMIDKTPERSFPESMWDLYRYPNARIEIGKFNSQTDQVQRLQGIQSAKRTLFKDYNLSIGEYIVYVKMDFNSQYEKDYDVNLAVYSEIAVEILLASNKEACTFHNKQVAWDGMPDQSSEAGKWNNLGNVEWGNNSTFINPGKKNDDGWGGQFGGGGNNGNQGGNQGNQGGNDGWGDYFGGGGGNNNNNNNNHNNNNNNNNGWGNNNQGGNSANDGWGNTNNNMGGNNQAKKDDGWGNHFSGGNQGNNNQGNNGWEAPKPNIGNNNEKFQQNEGWGDYFDKNKPNTNNNNAGWGNSQPSSNNNSGWGNQGGNNGWGNQGGSNNNNNGW